MGACRTAAAVLVGTALLSFAACTTFNDVSRPENGGEQAGEAGQSGGGETDAAAGSSQAGSSGAAGGQAGSAAGGSAGSTPTDCHTDEDCNDGNPCTTDTCPSGQCSYERKQSGTACDDSDACNGHETCNGIGQCIPGSAPVINDNNVCTNDTCDPQSGVHHSELSLDDNNACTTDSCDEQSGPSHVPVSVSDGNDCTDDGCDQASGVYHHERQTLLQCGTDCPSGYHVQQLFCNYGCGACFSPDTNQASCAPNCGDSFPVCGLSCPSGYHGVNSMCATGFCGDCNFDSPNQTFCVRN